MLDVSKSDVFGLSIEKKCKAQIIEKPVENNIFMINGLKQGVFFFYCDIRWMTELRWADYLPSEVSEIVFQSMVLVRSVLLEVWPRWLVGLIVDVFF